MPKWPIKYEDIHASYIDAAFFLARHKSIITNSYKPILNGDLIYKPFSLPGADGPRRLTTKASIRNNAANIQTKGSKTSGEIIICFSL